MKKLKIVLGFLFAASCFLPAQNPAGTVPSDVARETIGPVSPKDYKLEVLSDRPGGLYQIGETAVFRIRLLNKDRVQTGEEIRYLLQGEKFFRKSGVLTNGEGVSEIRVPLALPGFVLCEVSCVLKADGKTLISGAAGAGAEPEKLSAETPEPEDFDAFWTAQKKELAAVPRVELERVSVAVKDPAYANKVVMFDVKVSCAGGPPVSGYLTQPVETRAGGHPVLVSYHGAGVGSARPQYERAALGVICFDINAHGIQNGQSREYYEKLRDGELKNYFFLGNKSRDTAYFRGMFLRVLRSLDYVKSLAEWNGKDLIVTGGSQGGAQAMAAAGLDPQVSFCAAAAPWLCNLNGVTEGSVPPNWPGFIKMNGSQVETPDVAKVLAYFDPALHIKRSRGECVLSAGFQDRASPPATIYVAFNQIPGVKTMIPCPQDTHSGPSIYQKVNEAVMVHFEKILKVR